MSRPLLRLLLCVLLVAGAGCSGGGGDEEVYGYPEDPPTDEDCVYPRNVDPNVPKCYVSTHPPDLAISNRANVTHQLSIDVVYEGNGTVYAETVSVGPNNRTTEADVFDRPGNYTITATLSDSETVVETWSLGDRYVGEGGPGWMVSVSDEGELYNRRVGHM